MADRYLLESGSPDGYLLEDGSGVYVLETVITFNVGVTTCFTDTAGTVQVTLDGDLVACIRDSITGSIIATQATSGARPVYRASGHPYLEFSGAQNLVSAALPLTDAYGRHSSGAAVQFANLTGVQSVLDSDDLGGGRLAQILRSNAGTLETIAFNVAPTAFTDVGPAITVATDSVLTEITSTSTTEAFLNGTGNGSTAVTPAMYSAAAVLNIGAWNVTSPGNYFSGRLYGFRIRQGAMTATDHSAMVTALQRLYTAAALTVNVGSYTLTGTATGLKYGRNLPVTPGSYSIAGIPAVLRVARKQVEAVGSYAIAGTATTLRVGRKPLVANVGSYAVTGTATGLRKGYNQTEAVGSYSITGVATALRVARKQVEAVGSYSISGVAVTFAVSMPVLVGSYSVSGQAVTFRVAMPSAVGSYAITGTSTALRIARRQVEAVGSYAISGQSVTLTYGAAARVLTVAAGSYSLGGVSTALRASRQLAAVVGSYAIVGVATGLKAARRLSAAPGAYSITGVGPVLARGLPIVSGSYALTGVSVNLRRAARLPVLVGAYALTGLASFLSVTRRLGVSQGAYVITGTAALLQLSKRLGAASGFYVLTGYDADLRTNDVILRLNVGSYVLTGTALGFIKTVAVPPSRIVAPSSVARLIQAPPREFVAQAASVGRVVSPSRRLA